MKKVARILLFFVLPILLVIMLTVIAVLPRMAKNYINKHGIEYTGRKTEVTGISINYFSATLTATGFRLFEKDSAASFLSFDTLEVSAAPFRLFASEVVVKKFRLVAPVVNIGRQDTLYNFDDILAFWNARPKEPAKKESGRKFSVKLHNISMEGGKLVFRDMTVGHTTVMNDLKFFIPSLYLDQDEVKDAGVRFHFENGGYLQATTGYNMKDGSYRADFTLDKLDIAPFLPYARNYFKVQEIGGIFSGRFSAAGNVGSPDSVQISGQGTMAGFYANDLANRKVLGAKQAVFTIGDSRPLKDDYRLGKISLVEPYLLVEMKDSTINMLNLLNDQGPADTTAPTAYHYKIGEMTIENGLLELRDLSYEEPFVYNLSEISLKVDSLSSESKWVNLYSGMRLNQRGKLQAELGINPSDPYEMRVKYVISNFQLTDLNIYSRHFVGFPILLGNMYYKGNTVIRGKQLSSENKLIIRDAKLGRKQGGIMNIPLKLALYLLKDIHGDITLDIPVSGDLNDPKTRIGRLVWQTFKTFIVKVVASPFLALGSALGVDPDEVKGLEFNYADSVLTDQQLRRIRMFTEIAARKPDMKIELTCFNDSALEKQEIARREAGRMFRETTGLDYTRETEKFRQFLAGRLSSDSISTDRGSILLAGRQRIDSIQQACNLARIRKTESALKSFDDSTRIRVVMAPAGSPEHVGSHPVFRFSCSVDE